MKYTFFLIILFVAPSLSFASDDISMSEKIIDIELNQNKAKSLSDSTVVAVRKNSLDDNSEDNKHFKEAEVIDKVNNEEEDIKKIKVEIGAEHKPINYPKFLASVFTLDFSDPRINIEKIVDGGVVVDEIPTLVNPLIIPIKEADDYLHYADDEYMAVIEINGDARAYPLSVLNWHQGVNDIIGGQPIFVAYDPLSGNIFAMDRRVAGKKETTFGVTGQVYKSASLYYDRATKSIWSSFENMAVTGKLAGQKMKRYSASLTTWSAYKRTYPKGMVLDLMDTGYERNYRQNPYGDYATNSQMLFPVAYANETFPRKEYVLGIKMYKNSRRVDVAIPVNLLLNSNKEKLDFAFEEVQVIGSKVIPVTVELKAPYGRVEVYSPDEDVIIETSYGFWFVWSAYNKNTRVITSLD